MAQVGCTRPLQLLCGARKPHEPGRVSRSRDGSLVAYATSPQPETSDIVHADSRFRSQMASDTARTPPLSRCTLRRYTSVIRTGCAKERSSGSVRGVSRERYPYRDQQLSAAAQNLLLDKTGTLIGITDQEIVRF